MSKNIIRRLLAVAGMSGLTLGFAAPALADWEVNMTRGVTALSEEIYGLHMLILGVCVAIAVVVFGVMIISLVKHRKSRGVQPATFSHSTKAEIIWTIIPVLILVGMAVPSAETLIRMEDTSNSDMTVKVTGYQWKWRYDYLDEGIGFFSSLAEPSYRARQLGSGIDPHTVDNYLLEVDNPLVVPVGAKVRLLLTGADVIHSWWVPDLGGKRDAIPGFVNEFTFTAEKTGIFRGQCAELCGRGHGFMPVVVNVLPEDEYVAWLGEQGAVRESAAIAAPATEGPVTAMAAATVAEVEIDLAAADAPAGEWDLTTAMAQGEQHYNTYCGACHQANGQGLPPAFPAIAGSAVATGDVAPHIDIGLNGRPGTAMVGFGPQLSDQQLAAIITYQRNAFGNDTGDLVTPADIAAAR